MPNAVRRRKLGLSPIVTSASRAGLHEYSAFHDRLRDPSSASASGAGTRASRAPDRLPARARQLHGTSECATCARSAGAAGPWPRDRRHRVIASSSPIRHRSIAIDCRRSLRRALAPRADSRRSMRISPRVRRRLPAEERRDHRVDLLLARRVAQPRRLRPPRELAPGIAVRRERHSEVDPIEDRARVHPRVARLGPPVRRLVAEDRLRRGSATSCAVRGVVSGCASSARSALATTSNGDLHLARIRRAAKNSGDVTIVRTTSRMSPSVRVNVCAARSTSACGGLSLTKRHRELAWR